MPGVKVPADVEREDRLAFGLTARQLAILAGSALGGLRSRGRTRRRPARAVPARGRRPRRCRRPLARAPPPRRPRRRPARPRRGTVRGRPTPAGARSRRPPCPAPGQPRRPPGSLPSSCRSGRILPSGVVELADGSHCLLLAARGSGFELRAAAEQAALVAAFARFLNGLSEPLQIVVQSERISLAGLRRAARAGGGDAIRADPRGRPEPRRLPAIARRRDGAAPPTPDRPRPPRGRAAGDRGGRPRPRRRPGRRAARGGRRRADHAHG